MHVLIAEKGYSLTKEYVAAMGQSRLAPAHAGNGKDAITASTEGRYDLVMLERELPDMDGCAVVREMRGRGHSVPIMMLSHIIGSRAAVEALSAGADDHVCWPFDRNELAARVHAVIRRGKPQRAEMVLTDGDLVVSQEAMSVTVRGENAHLTAKEFEVLWLLMSKKGHPVSKAAILTHLYQGMDVPDPKIIDVYVCKVRKKLFDARAGNVITTVWSQGYTFIGNRQVAAQMSAA